MCGINGFISHHITDLSEAGSILEKMNHSIFHRGPDEDGFFTGISHGKTIAMAMRRLSIIDLSSGKQPIFSDDKDIVITFNGEIYNYKELKDEYLKSENFHTKSDTEVILKLYQKFGTSSFKMLDGMFTFSIFDKNAGKLFIARDFFGEKPLYYRYNSGDFYWCSELKSLKSVSTEKLEINTEALNIFFQLTYIPAPYTIYDGVKKLEANHFIEFSLDTFNFEIKRIEDEVPPEKNKISFEDAKKHVRNLVEESVLSRSVSDVPIGTFLSGGVDSSIVSLCLARKYEQKINTFSIGFHQRNFDETDKSRIVAKLINSNHHEFVISEKDLEEDIDRILLNFDEPFADSSALPTFLVAQKTSEFVKVALTGDGGDEVFGGYNKHLIGKINSRYTNYISENQHKKIKGAISSLLHQKEDTRGLKFKIRKAINAIDYEHSYYFNILKLGFQEVELQKILQKQSFRNDVLEYYLQKNPKPKSITEFRMIDKVTSLEGDMLVKVDRTSMMSSLECRAPFLNKKIWDYVNTLPENFLIKGNHKKIIVKKAFEEDFPKGFLEKSKKGFGVPVGNWLKTILRDELLGYIDEKKLEEQNIFDKKSIISLVNDHLKGIKDNTFRVWTFYCFQKWYFKNF